MIAVTGHKFTIGKEEYLPYSVEMQYFRVSKRYWSICFERIRRAGFKVISTAVPWSIHEDNHREFDFSGFSDPAKDLIVFIELAREFGFKIILRPGPMVSSEIEHGGLPLFLSKYPEVFSVDSEGALSQTDLQNGMPEFAYPSNMHPRMQNFVKHYFNGLTEIVKNYIYPRGPLFLVELDSGNYFGGDPFPWKSDYNPYVVSTLYPQFLEKRYENVKTLNSAYGENAADFAAVQPPRDFIVAKDRSLTKLLDWYRFKEYLIKEHGAHLIEQYKSFSCEPLFYQTLAFYKTFQAPLTPILDSDGEVFPTISIGWDSTSTGTLQKIRYLRANSEFPWGSSVSVGNNTSDAATSKKHFHISGDATKYLLSLALAGGIKGFSQYKFVESDNWYDSPLGADGAIQESYEIVRKLMTFTTQTDIGVYESQTTLGISCYKLNNWISLLEDSAGFGYVQTLNEFTMPEIGRDLDRIKQDFVIPDLDNPLSFEKLKNVVVPVSEIMDADKQEFLLEKAKEGVNLILIGLMPKFDSDLNNCQTLANAIHCKTAPLGKIGNVSASNDQFPSYVYGSIACTEKKSKKLATYAGKTVGIKINRYKGTIVLLSFDCSSQGNYAKINFLKNTLSDLGVSFRITTSHPNVRAFIHKGEKSGMFYLLNSSPSQPFRRSKTAATKVVVQVDLKAFGYRGSKVNMVDVFTDEEILTTMEELREGLYFSLGNLDSRAYHFTVKS
jgi:beta-galactosidase